VANGFYNLPFEQCLHRPRNAVRKEPERVWYQPDCHRVELSVAMRRSLRRASQPSESA
jgi:hypothetical protein